MTLYTFYPIQSCLQAVSRGVAQYLDSPYARIMSSKANKRRSDALSAGAARPASQLAVQSASPAAVAATVRSARSSVRSPTQSAAVDRLAAVRSVGQPISQSLLPAAAAGIRPLIRPSTTSADSSSTADNHNDGDGTSPGAVVDSESLDVEEVGAQAGAQVAAPSKLLLKSQDVVKIVSALEAFKSAHPSTNVFLSGSAENQWTFVASQVTDQIIRERAVGMHKRKS